MTGENEGSGGNGPERDRRVHNYKEIAEGTIPAELRAFLPTSFDIVGDIAVVKIPDELSAHSQEIGSAILRAYKSIKTVARDTGVSGGLRQRSVDIIAGENRTTASHREYNVVLRVDIAKAYFSPRLATERWRVAQQVAEGEFVVDAFAGVGPFSIIIAKHRKPGKVVAIDINPDAVGLLRANIAGNKVGGVVEPVLGDAASAMPDACRDRKADRIIMNLPWSASDYFDAALDSVAEGGTIHYYEIADRADVPGIPGRLAVKARAKRLTLDAGKGRQIKSYSPSQEHWGFDVRVREK